MSTILFFSQGIQEILQQWIRGMEKAQDIHSTVALPIQFFLFLISRHSEIQFDGNIARTQLEFGHE